MVPRDVPLYHGSSVSHDDGDLHCIYCMQSACSEWKEVLFLHLKERWKLLVVSAYFPMIYAINNFLLSRRSGCGLFAGMIRFIDILGSPSRILAIYRADVYLRYTF